MYMRNSSFELLRIVAMLMIVIHHFILHGICRNVMPDSIGLLVANQSVIYGVNLFLFITAYWGIKLKWKSFLGLLFICSFYKIIHLCIDIGIFDTPHAWYEWIAKPLMVFSHPGGWFVNVYIYLLLLSPLLNAAIHQMSKKQYHKVLVLLTILEIYSGYIWGQSVSNMGHDLFHFAYIYLLGRYIALYPITFRPTKIIILIGYALTTIFPVLLYYYFNTLPPFKQILAYNSPFVIVGAWLIFAFFQQLHLQSDVINRVAASMLPVYLLHDAPTSILPNFIYNEVHTAYIQNFIGGKIILIFVGLFICVILIDSIRLWLGEKIVTPIANYLNNKFNESKL